MSKYTVEEVRDYADACALLHKGPAIAEMLYAYAATLEQQAEWPGDADTNVFLDLYEGPRSHPRSIDHIEKVRAALQSVRPPASHHALLTGTTDSGLPYGLHGTVESVSALSDYLARLEENPDAVAVSDEDNIPEAVRTAPERIFLQVDTEEVEYVRADLAQIIDLDAQGQPPASPAGVQDVQEKYNELILAVGNKYRDETRHETALRYIKQAEQQSSIPRAAAPSASSEEVE